MISPEHHYLHNAIECNNKLLCFTAALSFGQLVFVYGKSNLPKTVCLLLTELQMSNSCACQRDVSCYSVLIDIVTNMTRNRLFSLALVTARKCTLHLRDAIDIPEMRYCYGSEEINNRLLHQSCPNMSRLITVWQRFDATRHSLQGFYLPRYINGR